MPPEAFVEPRISAGTVQVRGGFREGTYSEIDRVFIRLWFRDTSTDYTTMYMFGANTLIYAIHVMNRTYILLRTLSGLPKRTSTCGKQQCCTVGRSQWSVSCGLPLCVPAKTNPTTGEPTNRDWLLLSRRLSLCYKMWLPLPPKGPNQLGRTYFFVLARAVIESKVVF